MRVGGSGADGARAARLRGPLYSVRAKLLAVLLPIVALATLLSLAGLSLFLEDFFRRHMEAESSTLAEAIKASLQEQMLQRIDGLTQRTLESVGEAGHLKRILIVNAAGRVAHAYPASERGRVFDRASDPVCQNCHVAAAPPVARASLATDHSGDRIFRLATPLSNQTRCHRCHDPAARFNGMLLIERSAGAETEALATIRWRLALTWAATLGALSLLIVGVTTAFVHRPVRKLIEGTRRIGGGDFGTRVTVPVRGELQELAGALNTMTANLAASLDEIQNKSVELSVLYSIVDRISKSVFLGELKPLVLGMVAEVLRSPRVVLVSRGLEPDELEIHERFAGGDLGHQLARLEDVGNGKLGVPSALLKDWVSGAVGEISLNSHHRLAVLPLRFRARDLALLLVGEPPDRAFGPADLRLMGALCDHISVAFENARLYTLAITDELTQLYSLRYFQISLEEAIGRVQRYGEPAALLMLDLDHFKTVNDAYGHPAGDLVLKEVARRIRASLREVDLPCRYGGEEFAAILSNTDERGACIVAERIRSSVATAPFALPTGATVSVTVSIGVAECPRQATTARDVVSLADRALYRAKRSGRDRVCAAGAG